MEFEFIFAPLITLVGGIIMGTIFNFLPVKKFHTKTITMASFAVASALALYVVSNLYSNNLTSIFYFQAFAAVINGTLISNILGGYAPFASAILLSVVFEISLALSFAGEATVTKYYGKQKNKNTPQSVQTLTIQQPTFVNEKGLLQDEQQIMTIFRQGAIKHITPVINAAQPEGYSFEGPLQEWDTKWARHVLDSLVLKGYLKAELVDKVVMCTACSSVNVRIKKLCPNCYSLWLRKEVLIEHFSCGAVDRRDAYESAEGALVCPFCKEKLQSVGVDFRILPPSYVCLSCNSRTGSPLLMAKCENCGTTAELDEEPEIELYKYTAT